MLTTNPLAQAKAGGLPGSRPELLERAKPGVGCYLVGVGPRAFVGPHITPQPEERLIQKAPGLSHSVTGGPLGLRSHLC